MKLKRRLLVLTFLLSCGLLLSLLLLFSLNNFLEMLQGQGLRSNELLVLPRNLRPVYKGMPSVISLVCYCLFTFSAFLFLKESNRSFKTISYLSFALMLLLLIFFF